MGIVNVFENDFRGQHAGHCAFSLIEYDAGFFVGVDSEGCAAVVVNSSTPKAHAFVQETRALKLEYNVRVKCSINGTVTEGAVHALTCIPRDYDSVKIFLELADLLLHEADGTAESVLSVYATLSGFFRNTETLTDNELLGMYGELFTICDYSTVFDFASCWQSTDRMKFDFSISDRLKVEVKSTLKPQRIHHFKHNQIVADGCDFYVLSYRMQPDDQGLSLYDLIEESKALCAGDTRKIMKLQSVVKCAGSDRLKDFRFNQNFTRQERYVYYSMELPHFDGGSPEGVSSAEYDVDFTGAKTISEEVFLQIVAAEADE